MHHLIVYLFDFQSIFFTIRSERDHVRRNGRTAPRYTRNNHGLLAIRHFLIMLGFIVVLGRANRRKKAESKFNLSKRNNFPTNFCK